MESYRPCGRCGYEHKCSSLTLAMMCFNFGGVAFMPDSIIKEGKGMGKGRN